MSAALFLAALDTYVVVTVIPGMMFDLGIAVDRIEQATPIITGFLLGYIVAMPLLGAVSDVYGRREVFLGSLAIFALGSLVTASAGLLAFPSQDAGGLPWLVTGRVLQGLGGGALVPVALALAADLYPVGARALALGSISALQETGSVLGPLYGALVATAAASFGSWRVIFWVNLPLAALCAAALYWVSRGAIVLRRDRVANPPLHAVDWLGGLLLGGGLGLLVFGLYPDDPTHHAVGALFVPATVVSLLALGAYLWRQRTIASPLIPPRLWRGRVFLGANLTNLLVGAGLMVALVDVPIVGRLVFQQGELNAALLLVRFMIAVPIGALLGGWLAAILGYRLTACLGLGLAAVAFVLMAGWRADELAHQWLGIAPAHLTLALCGLGFGIVIAPVAAAILDRAEGEEHGLASSLVVLARVVGMLIGLSSLAAFGLHRFYQLIGSISVDLASTDLLRQRIAAALLEEYHEIFLVAAGVCVVAAAVALSTLQGRPVRTGI